MNTERSAVSVSNGDHYRWMILGLLTTAQLVMSLGAYSWGPMAPFLRDAFGISRTQIGTIVSSLYLFSVIIALPSGIAVDRLGSRIMLIIALAIMGGSFILLSAANYFSIIIILAGISGIGYGMINQISTKAIMIWFRSTTRATVMGIKQTGVTLGGALGAVLLPALSIAYGWRVAMITTGALMLIIAIASCVYYREQPVTAPAANSTNAPSPPSNWRKDFSDLWSKRSIRLLCFVSMLLASSQTCIASFLVLYLEEDLNLSIAMSGICLSLFMMAGTAGRIIWGIISDRIFGGDRQKPIIILSVIACATALCVAFFSPSSPLFLIFLCCILLGFTFMGWNAVYLTLGAEIAGPKLAGAVTGITITVCWTGIILGPPIFGIISDTVGYFWGWIMLSLFGCISAISFARFSKVTVQNMAE
ncbi:MAG: MFS transporter [Deltaproteobacteria bacterium]|nr:MFS transporter [Deltaproteobacteria bacterium]